MKKQLANKRTNMTVNMQDYNNVLPLPRYIMGGEGGETQSQTKQHLNAQLTTQ